MSLEAIEGLEPKILWTRFYELTQTPRPSKKEEKVRLYLKNTANSLNLKYKEDAVGNIVILLPASEGYENSQTVVLQAHIDMVCEKDKSDKIDFENDPLELIRDGEFIRANNTTLGADNGIGAAAMLAVLSDSSFSHGPIECLFTIDEETGLTGVHNLQSGFITGKVLLNTDSEEDGIFYIGCAGGQDTVGIYKIPFCSIPEGFTAYSISVKGLIGGHSGIEINTGRANAIKLLARIMSNMNDLEYYVVSVEGGSKRNAIARDAETIIAIKNENVEEIRKRISESYCDFKNEYKKNDKGIEIVFSENKGSFSQACSSEFSRVLIDVLLSLPHGVISMSSDIEGLVETSTNLATVVQENDELKIGTSQRSSIESSKRYIADCVQAVFRLTGAEIRTGDGYPGWQPDPESNVLKLAKGIYESMYKSSPEIKAIHAGLECGIFGEKFPGLDMISFGPTILGAHSLEERVEIGTVGKFYDFLKALLEELAKK